MHGEKLGPTSLFVHIDIDKPSAWCFFGFSFSSASAAAMTNLASIWWWWWCKQGSLWHPPAGKIQNQKVQNSVDFPTAGNFWLAAGEIELREAPIVNNRSIVKCEIRWIVIKLRVFRLQETAETFSCWWLVMNFTSVFNVSYGCIRILECRGPVERRALWSPEVQISFVECCTW